LRPHTPKACNLKCSRIRKFDSRSMAWEFFTVDGFTHVTAGSQLLARRFGASVQRQRTVLTLNIPSAGNVRSILARGRSKKAAPDSPGLSPSYARFLILPRALAPGCRFARRIIERTSRKLADVWGPDAVNDAGGRDDCAVFVAPRRLGP
jgi:hypothetical protein